MFGGGARWILRIDSPKDLNLGSSPAMTRVDHLTNAAGAAWSLQHGT
jgi:hypothetical protein